MTPRITLVVAALSAALAVALGAFGAHALKGMVSTHYLSVWQTANDYHFYHAFALLLLASVGLQRRVWFRAWLAWGFVLGTLLFCGSLYVLVLWQQTWLGVITPLGGSVWILSWLAWAWVLLSSPESEAS